MCMQVKPIDNMRDPHMQHRAVLMELGDDLTSPPKPKRSNTLGRGVQACNGYNNFLFLYPIRLVLV